MNITLEMVDEVIDRTGASYKEAKEALERFDGDILKAIVFIEEGEGVKLGHRDIAGEIVQSIKRLVNAGLVSQIRIEKAGKIILDVPIVAGAISAVLFTFSTAAAIVAALATGCEIKIIKRDGGEININALTQEKLDEILVLLKEMDERNKDER